MAARRPWTRSELLVAFALYLKLPFGQLHHRHPEIAAQAARIDRTPGALAMKLVNIASLDDSITRTGRSGLRNASNADREMWAEMQSDWPAFTAAAEAALQEAVAPAEAATEAAAEPDLGEGRDEPTTATRRRGQALFRQTVLSAYRNQCALTGLADQRLLIASHIIPWAQDPEMRLNPRNGIALNPLHDKAFDQGLITFDDDLRLQISPALRTADSDFVHLTFTRQTGTQLAIPEKFAPDPEALAYHRARIFIR